MPDPETPEPLPEQPPTDPPLDPQPPPPAPADTAKRSAQLKAAMVGYTVWRAVEGIEPGAKRMRVTMRAPTPSLDFMKGLSESDWGLIGDGYPPSSFGAGGSGPIKTIDPRTLSRTVRILTD